MDYFLEMYGRLPRAGPGSTDCTRRAFDMVPGLPAGARILDIGCGPGRQTLELLTLTDAEITALDFLPMMLERTRALAVRHDVADRLVLLEKDMADMDFPEGFFDLIWSEGAIYNVGFEAGLNLVKPFLRPRGFVAFSDAVWLSGERPAEVLRFWEAYPEIDTVENKLAVAERAGYETVGHFILPANTWTDEYYDPMEQLISVKKKEWFAIPEAMAVIEEAELEIALFRKFPDVYSYGFFVMRGP